MLGHVVVRDARHAHGCSLNSFALPRSAANRKLVQNRLGRAVVSVAGKLGMRLWVMLRNEIHLPKDLSLWTDEQKR